jgi:hypothetical protein
MELREESVGFMNAENSAVADSIMGLTERSPDSGSGLVKMSQEKWVVSI